MKQWFRGGANNTPHHASGTRATDRALSHTRSLTAAAVAVAMMATVAVTALLPTYNAKADVTSGTAGICTPKTLQLGGLNATASPDDSVATYVGGNMYVGANNQNSGGAYDTLNASQKIDQSYAVEAEGLTLVNGKLATNGVKASWNSKGFRFGVVGFGAQFRPKTGSDALVVAGSATSNIGASTGIMHENSDHEASAIGGFDDGATGRAFVNAGANNDPATYTARINGVTSWHFNDSVAGGANAGRSVWDASKGDDEASTNVSYSSDVNLSSVKNDGTDGDSKDYSNFYNDNVSGLSKQLAAWQTTVPGVYVANATVDIAEVETKYTRHHYNYDGNNNKISFDFTFNSDSKMVSGGNESYTNNEKLITFTGDNMSSMQVFNVSADQLSSRGYRGVDFAFTNIPDDASVVVNVSGPNIDFHNGWRFWWNGTEIGDGYSKAAEDMQKNLYSAAAQKIMWNFKEATQVTIRGGVANESASEPDGNQGAKFTEDDPAAAMLGSILIPNGNFEDHVTTNGRVYVGGDFSMYNPTAIPYVNNNDGWEGRTASVINMDQERHNLPWNGTFNSSCAVIQINKVDSSKKELAGTTWGVFKKYEDAKAGTATNALRVVKDGGAFDLDDADNGTIQIGSLNPNATYYLKEIASTDGFKVSDKVYRIEAGNSGTITQEVQESSDGITWPDVENNQIVNQPSGANLEWSKVDGGDPNKELAGSEWQLQMKDSTVVYRITDSTKDVASVKLYYNGTVRDENNAITMTDGIPFDLTASVFANDDTTNGVPQDVQWTATGSVVVNEGTVTAVNDGVGTVTACSLAASDKCAKVNVTVPAGTIIPQTPKTTTIFYPIGGNFTLGNTYLRYSLNGGTSWSDQTTPNSDIAFAAAEGCAEKWQSVTINNEDSTNRTVQFVIRGAGNNWDNNGGKNYEIGLADGATFYKSDNAFMQGVPDPSCTVNSGGTTSNKSVTINNAGNYVIGLRDDTKNLQLSATTKPEDDTVTWYSGNENVATVNRNGLVTGVNPGTATITAHSASGAQDSITITVKDDSLINVYFKKSTVNWGNAYYLHYQQAAGTNWAVVEMTDAPGCSDYVMASILRSNVIAGHGYYFRDGEDAQSPNWYNQKGVKGDGNSPFTFASGRYSDMYVNTNGDKNTGKPYAGCSATTQSAARVKARVSTAVLRTKTAVTAVDDENSSGTSAQSGETNTLTVAECGDAAGKCDTNTKPGEFRVVDLANGTYTLTETVAPNGFILTNRTDENGQVLYGQVYDVVIENGKVSSITDHYDSTKEPITDNKILNTRNTGTISWNKISSDSNNGKNLSGSEWKLTRIKNFGWNNGAAAASKKGKAEYTDIAEADQPTWSITDCKTGEGTTCVAPMGADGKAQTIYDVDPIEGQFKLEGLEWGTYTLEETKSPDGYDLDSTNREFTFGPKAGTDGTGQWNQNSANPFAGFTKEEKDAFAKLNFQDAGSAQNLIQSDQIVYTKLTGGYNAVVTDKTDASINNALTKSEVTYYKDGKKVEATNPSGVDTQTVTYTGKYSKKSVTFVFTTSSDSGLTGKFTTTAVDYDSDVFDFAVGGIKNQPGVVLPATGGEGNMKIFAAAIAAAMVAVVAACMALKVRRRQ